MNVIYLSKQRRCKVNECRFASNNGLSKATARLLKKQHRAQKNGSLNILVKCNVSLGLKEETFLKSNLKCRKIYELNSTL